MIAYCSTLYEYVGRSSSELSFGVGEIVHLISHLDDDWCFGELDGKSGAFPTSYVHIIVDCDAANDDQVQPSSVVETTVALPQVPEIPSPSHLASQDGNNTELYGRLICDFEAINVNEIDAAEGETVTVLRHIDSDWLEVRHDNGKVGLCPTSFVELFSAEPEPEPAIKPDIRTPAAVKPKLPVKPKSLTTTKSRGGVPPPAKVDQHKKTPVSADQPVLSPPPVRTQPDNSTFLPSTANVLTSPTVEAPKSIHYSTTTTTVISSFSSTSRQTLSSHDLSLDELIQAQLMSAKSSSSMAADLKPPDQRTIALSDYTPWVTLNGVADVAGQSGWHKFGESEQVSSPPAVTRKPPPPPRPAPSRPPQTAVTSSLLPSTGSENGPDVLVAQNKPATNLIELSPDQTSGNLISCVFSTSLVIDEGV